MPINDANRQFETLTANSMNVLHHSAEMWLASQSEMLRLIESMTSDWISHRRKQIESSQEIVRQIGEARDPAEILRLHNEWIKDCFETAAAEMHDANAGVVKMVEVIRDTQSAVVRDIQQPVRQRMAG